MDAPRVWVPKVKILEAGIAGPAARAEGYFRVEACNRYGHVRRAAEWKQLITDLGMPFLFWFSNSTASGGAHSQCRVGNGSPSFTPGSTGLDSPIGSHTFASPSATNTIDLVGTNDYRETHTKVWEFPLGGIVGNLTEVGLFTAANNTSGAFLDLIRDDMGAPTSFPVTADDQLRVAHTLYRYPFLGVSDGDFSIGGSAGSGTHDFELNMASLGDSLGAGSTFAGTFGLGNNSAQGWQLQGFRDVSAIGANTVALPTGAVSLGTVAPSGLGTGDDDGTTWTRTKEFVLGLTAMNHANGISGFRFRENNGRAYKLYVDPPIPKFAGSIQRILTLEFSVGVTRA